MDTLKFVEKLPIFGLLTRKQKELFASNIEVRNYKQGDIILDSVDDNLGPFIVLDGIVRVTLNNNDIESVRDVTLYRLYKDDVGLLSAACVIEPITFDMHIVASVNSTLAMIKADTLKRILDENIKARCYIYELILDRFSLTVGSMEKIMYTSVKSRIASFLIELSLSLEALEFRLTQEHLAIEISSSREVVGRELKQLIRDGILTNNRGNISILNMNALKAYV